MAPPDPRIRQRRAGGPTPLLLLLAAAAALLACRSCYAQPAQTNDYMGFVDKHLPAATGNRRDVLLALRDLYVDLAEQRRPRTFGFQSGNVTLHPISFSIPEEMVARTPPPKDTRVHLPHWASKKPRTQRATDADGEVAFYKSMSRSYYSLTTKKSGWDCLRHLEVLAAGAVPLFTDVGDAPVSSLSSYPKRLFSAVLSEPSLKIKGKKLNDHFTIVMNLRRLDAELYMVTVQALLVYTRTVLTTGAMAQHVLNVMGLPATQTVLFLTAKDPKQDYNSLLYGDYMADTLLHGFKRLLGQSNVVDSSRRTAQYRTAQDIMLPVFLRARNDHYGDGFSYAFKLFEADGAVDRENLEERIRTQEFGVVVFGEAHRGDITEHPLYEAVCRHVAPGRVAAVWGGDGPPTAEQPHVLDKLVARGCIKYLFSREING